MTPLASFLIILLTLIIANTGASQAMEEEVTISSDSAHLPRQKLRVVTWKVRFSHPLAYLDPHFLLKKQQHESRRQTRNDDEPPTVLQQTPQKCPNEVYFFVFYFSLLDLLPCITNFVFIFAGGVSLFWRLISNSIPDF